MRVNRDKLLQSLKMVEPGISPKEVLEQSTCFIFQDGQVQSYNDEVACVVPTDLKATGAIQARPLLAILEKMDVEYIEVRQAKESLSIKGKREWIDVRMEKEILLPIKNLEKPKKWKKLPKDFSEAVGLVQECAGRDDQDYELTCIHIHPKWIEACDNQQAARYRLATGLDRSILIRVVALHHIAPLGMSEVSETESWMHFRNGSGLVLSCRHYVESYPNLSKILNVTGEKVKLPKGLIKASERAEIFSADSSDENFVKVDLLPGKVRIIGQGTFGSYKATKPVTYSGRSISFTISPKLLCEIVKRKTECAVSEKALKIEGASFEYSVSLSVPKKEKENDSRSRKPKAKRSKSNVATDSSDKSSGSKRSSSKRNSTRSKST